MPKQSEDQKATVRRVMHEFKHGELVSHGSGRPVRDPDQAIAIALHEAGASRDESPEANRRALRRTKLKERRGQTAEALAEGKSAQDKTLAGSRRTRSP